MPIDTPVSDSTAPDLKPIEQILGAKPAKSSLKTISATSRQTLAPDEHDHRPRKAASKRNITIDEQASESKTLTLEEDKQYQKYRQENIDHWKEISKISSLQQSIWLDIKPIERERLEKVLAKEKLLVRQKETKSYLVQQHQVIAEAIQKLDKEIAELDIEIANEEADLEQKHGLEIDLIKKTLKAELELDRAYEEEIERSFRADISNPSASPSHTSEPVAAADQQPRGESYAYHLVSMTFSSLGIGCDREENSDDDSSNSSNNSDDRAYDNSSDENEDPGLPPSLTPAVVEQKTSTPEQSAAVEQQVYASEPPAVIEQLPPASLPQIERLLDDHVLTEISTNPGPQLPKYTPEMLAVLNNRWATPSPSPTQGLEDTESHFSYARQEV